MRSALIAPAGSFAVAALMLSAACAAGAVPREAAIRYFSVLVGALTFTVAALWLGDVLCRRRP